MPRIRRISMASIKQANKACAKKIGREWWFDPGAMRFFGTRIESGAIVGPRGTFFVTSETPWGDDEAGPRRYSVRRVLKGGCKIQTVGAFHQIERKEWAVAEARKLAGGPERRPKEFGGARGRGRRR